MSLAELGRKLASNPGFEPEDEVENTSSVIRVERAARGEWDVRVGNVVGVIALPDMQILVAPKIPLPHFLYLLSLTRAFPRVLPAVGALAGGPDFWSLLATWCVTAGEELLRKDLVRDYQDALQTSTTLRGSYDLREVSLATYRGAFRYDCEIEDFTTDIALNRVIRAGLVGVAMSPLSERALRKRAVALCARMDGVTAVRTNDLSVGLDRRTAHYQDAFTFAKHILQGTSRLLSPGVLRAWSFLMPTPTLIEDAIRNLLVGELRSECSVTKYPIRLRESDMTLNPDLIFTTSSQTTIGDVKYKLSEGQWHRSDLYQVITFAVGCRTNRALLATFSQGLRGTDRLDVGHIRATQVYWPAMADLPAEEAARRFVHSIRSWYNSVPTTTPG